jgi:hypothetical protein
MLIGLAGWARSGKDTLADYLVVFHDYKKVAFADPMREALVRLNPTIELGNFKLAKLATSVNVFGWEDVKSLSPDVRGLMQRLGTEVGRQMFGENFWVDQTMKRVAEIDGNCVVSDVRYPNEAQAIKDAGGIVIRIERNGVKAANEHTSESALDGFEFDLVIRNDGTLQEFMSNAELALKSVLR